MAIIYSYPTVTPESGDLIVGTDITGKVTKNFTVGSIVTAGIPTHITGTTNTVPVFTGTNTIGDSIITQDSGANGVSVGGAVENNRKFKVHGHSSVDGNLYLSGDSNNYSIEVGQSRSTEGVAILDLTGEVVPDDYGLRMIRYGGENAESAIIHTGTSNLRIRAENAADTVFENTKVGIGTTTPSSKLDVNGNVTSTYNAADTNTGAYGVSRTLSGLIVNARGYRDNTIITSPGNNTVSYAGIDLKSQSTNGTYGHVTMLQGRHSLDAANLTDFEGLYIGGLSFTNSSSATNYVGVTVENPTLFNGSITNFIGTNIKAPARSGGTITNFYGLKIEDNVSATNKWSVYSEDTSVKSKMLGQLESGDISVYNTGTNASLHLNSSSTAFGGNYIHAKKSDSSNQWVLGSNSGSSDQVVLKQYNDANIIFQNNSGDALTIQSNGSVGIGTTAVNAKLNVGGSVKIEGTNPLWFGGAGSIPTWQINASGNDLVIDDVGGNSGDLIFSGQNIGIGTTSPNEKLTINSGRMLVTGNNTPIYIKVSSNYKSWVHHISSDDGYIFAPSTADGGETWDWANQTKLGANGVVIAKNFELSADERLYDNVKDIEDNVIVAFKSFEIESSPGEKRYGVIAQELEINNPELVTTDAYGFKSVKYIDLLIAKIAELENRIQTLENE